MTRSIGTPRSFSQTAFRVVVRSALATLVLVHAVACGMARTEPGAARDVGVVAEALSCASDWECLAEGQRCDRQAGECVDCLGDADCFWRGQVCQNAVCVELSGLYERCQQGSGEDLQGSCRDGLYCQQVISGEPYCYDATPCASGTVPYFDLVCLATCSAPGGCPSGTSCAPNTDFCVAGLL